MSRARDEILARIRAALGRDGVDPATRERLDRGLAGPPVHDRPAVGDDLLRSFESKLTAVQGVIRITGPAGVMDAIAQCLDDHGGERTLIAAPALEKKLSWPAGWDVTFGPSRGKDRISVTPCFAAVAETGSVVLVSGRDTPTSLNFLPEFHVVLVHADQLVRHVEDVWTRLRDAGITPRTVNFITGPSKTADVEQTIQYGAHGPRGLDVIYIDDANVM
jgi:L-lactate dehydrogenase complex protein LldG